MTEVLENSATRWSGIRFIKKNTYVEEVETSLAQPTLPISMQFQQRLQVKGYMLSKNVNCLQ